MVKADIVHWLSQLERGLATLQLSLPVVQQEKLINYLQLLAHWNQRINLTAIKSVEKMIAYHLLDSLALAPYIRGSDVLDVGTGAGLPGIPLACYFPQKRWILLDSNNKKTRFLRQACMEFKIANVTVENARIEALSSDKTFDTVVARAFASLEKTVAVTQWQLKPGGRLVLPKGRYPQQELASLRGRHQVETLSVPGVLGERHVVVIDFP